MEAKYKLKSSILPFFCLKMMKGRQSFYFWYFIVLLFATTSHLADASRSQPQKTILKTIKSQDGDVVDCVHIYHQPAFDHPLLKDHKIKMKPSTYPQGFLLNSNSAAANNTKQITQVWQLSGECPEGTVPIKRTDGRKSSSFRKKPLNITASKSPYSTGPGDYSNGNGHEYAIARLGTNKYYGAKAVISAWNPSVEGIHEFSLSQLWLVGDSAGSILDTIEVGWHVDPDVNHDSLTRLFIFWTNNNYQNGYGCYNLQCPGFVQTSNQMLIGGSIANPGEITLLVWKDERQQKWWLNYNDNTVGYWPFTLFSVLQDSASRVDFGGEIINSNTNGEHTTTQMGSGEFAESGNGKASYFRNLEVVNDANALVSPAGITIKTSNNQCYDIVVDNNDQWGNYFYYGGPGKSDKCP